MDAAGIFSEFFFYNYFARASFLDKSGESSASFSFYRSKYLFTGKRIIIQGMWNGGRNLIFFFATLAKLEKLHNAILFFNLISIDNVSPSV